MKFKKHLRLAAGMAAILLASGCGKASEAAVTEEVRVPVLTTQISPATIKSEVAYAGQIKANESVSIVGKMAGKVESVKFDIGDKVSAGDVLYTLDKKDVQNQITVLQANLKTASASVSSAQTGLRQVTGGQMQSSISQLETAMENADQSVEAAQNSLAAAQLAIENAELQLNDMTKTHEDTKVLFDAGVATRAQMDSVELGLNQATAGRQQAQIQYDQAQIQYNQALLGQKQSKETYEITTGSVINDSKEIAANGVNSAVAQRDAIAVQLEIANSTLNDLSVTSPINGVVTARNIGAGEMASMAVPSYVIENMDTVIVEVKVSEIIINKIAVGQDVDMFIKTLGNDVIVGKIKTISPSADATNMYSVQIELDNKNGLYKPGMFTEVSFVREISTDTIVIPRDTVLQDENGQFVYMNENGIAKRTLVETGIDNGKEIEIISGLAVGQEVITTGQSNLIDGDKLNVITPAGAAGSQDKNTAEPEQKDNEEE